MGIFEQDPCCLYGQVRNRGNNHKMRRREKKAWRRTGWPVERPRRKDVLLIERRVREEV
jgi:hypothetical protein